MKYEVQVNEFWTAGMITGHNSWVVEVDAVDRDAALAAARPPHKPPNCTGYTFVVKELK